MKYSERYLEMYRWMIARPRKKPSWLSEYEKGFNDGKIERWDYVFWTALIVGLMLGLMTIYLGLLLAAWLV